MQCVQQYKARKIFLSIKVSEDLSLLLKILLFLSLHIIRKKKEKEKKNLLRTAKLPVCLFERMVLEQAEQPVFYVEWEWEHQNPIKGCLEANPNPVCKLPMYENMVLSLIIRAA